MSGASGKSDTDSGVLTGAAAPGGQDPLIGKRFGNCLLQRRVGAGSMGQVYLAQHVGLNKQVAIKIMSAELINAAGTVDRFLREARTAAALEHPNVVQVFDVGEANGLYYLEMQYVEGRNLDKALEGKGKFDVREAVGIVKKIAMALGAAHKLNIVHRDIKPANVLLSKDGQIKVADFGLARSEDAGHTASMDGQIIGTPYYMSPEQAQGLPVDARADLYSLGATFYHLITGRRPFVADSPIGVILKHVNEAPDPPERIEPSIPGEISQIVLKLMAKRPDDRYASANDIVRALSAFEGPAGSAPTPGGDSMVDLFAPSEAPAPETKRVTKARPAPEAPRASKEAPAVDKGKAELKTAGGSYVPLRELRKEDEELSVWEAENARTKARVELRVLRSRNEERIRSFRRLADDGAKLKHPNIPRVIEFQSEGDPAGTTKHVMAVEPVNALTLEQVVAARMLPPKELVKIAEQVAQALEHAHQRGVTHHAINPRTVQVEPPARAILSFHDPRPSTDEEARADAPYLAPEQLPTSSADPDASTDIYRLGALLYWIVTGKPPFEAPTPEACREKILGAEPTPPRELDPNVDPELEAVILKAMRKAKEQRFSKAGDLSAALRRYLKVQTKDSPAPPASTRRASPKRSSKARLRQFLKTRRRELILSGTLLVVIGVGAQVLRARWAAEALAEEMGAARLEALNRYAEGKHEEAIAAARKALRLADDSAMERLVKTSQRRLLEASALREVAGLEAASGQGAENAFLESVHELGRILNALRSEIGPSPGPEEANALVAIGLGSLALREPDAALAAFDRAAALDGRDPAGALGLARAAFLRVLYAEAVARAMGQPLDSDPRAQELRSKIVDAAERATHPVRTGVEADLADLYAAFGRGEHERVKLLAAAVLRQAPASASAIEALVLRAWTTGEVGDLDAAIKARPLHSVAFVVRALFALEKGRAAEAVADLDDAARLHANQPLFAFLRAKAKQAAGDLEGAAGDLAGVKQRVGSDWEFAAALRLLEDGLPSK